MAFDPKKWTLKTNEAFAAAIDQAKALSNPELTPDHLIAAMMRQENLLAGKIRSPRVSPVYARAFPLSEMSDRSILDMATCPTIIAGMPMMIPNGTDRTPRIPAITEVLDHAAETAGLAFRPVCCILGISTLHLTAAKSCMRRHQQGRASRTYTRAAVR